VYQKRRGKAVQNINLVDSFALSSKTSIHAM
jgi:hypothetical protein